MNKYEDLDGALIVCIDLGHNTMAKMESLSTLKTITNKMDLRDGRGDRVPHFRMIDRRLQALRKAGKIAYVASKWHVLEASK